MGLFNFLSPKKKEPISSVNDLFKINLKAIPDKRFNAIGLVKSQGGDFYGFDLTLNYLECGIFNEIDVFQKPDGGKRVCFINRNLLNVKIEKVKELIDSLFNLYGIDIDDKGRFTEQEKNEFYGHHELYLRSWYNLELPFSSIDINVDRESNELSMDINFIEADLSIENSYSNNDNKKGTINDLFKINLKELPDERFNENGFIPRENDAGFYSFDLTLDYLECDIFNEISVHQLLEGGMIVYFRSTNLLNVELEKVKELVNSLFNLYGIDCRDNGKYTEQDKNDFYGHHESSLRTWLDPELPLEMIDIDVDRKNNEMSLTIIVSKAE